MAPYDTWMQELLGWYVVANTERSLNMFLSLLMTPVSWYPFCIMFISILLDIKNVHLKHAFVVLT